MGRTSPYVLLKPKVLELRQQGKSYGEIRVLIKAFIPKSTLSNWCSEIPITKKYEQRIRSLMRRGSDRGLAAALVLHRARREEYLESIDEQNRHLTSLMANQKIAKIALAMLYLGEGAKNPKRACLCFGNSDPVLMQLFLGLLKKCYKVDPGKFRCRLQLRADQDKRKLERFWSKITGVPLQKFYRSYIDKRTIGKKSQKRDYKGVCVITYFSAYILLDLLSAAKVISRAHSSVG